MAGIVTNAVGALYAAWLIGVGGPLETGNVDVVLSSREGPIRAGDVYNAADLCPASGVVKQVGVDMSGPYIDTDGDEVVSAGSLFFESTVADPQITGVARQAWIVSQDVAPVLLAACMVRESEGGVNFAGPGVGAWIDVEIKV